MRFPASLLPLPVALSLTFGCSAGDATDGSSSPGTGGDLAGTGAASSGGSLASGGGTSTGGSVASGGTSASGGATNDTGGSSTGGSIETCTPSSGISDVGSSSFLDKATCLTWQKTNTYAGSVVNRAGAKHCQDLVQDGYDDWRLPTAQELRSYPNLPDSGNAYLAGPIYIPSNSTSTADGCTGNSHSCNLAQYSAGNYSCAWQGPGANSYGVFCVRGTAGVALDASFAVATCCAASSSYVETDCSAY